MDDLEEPIRVFIEESRENLERLDREVVALEQSPDDPHLISGIFRTLHTMKASCGFFGFQRLEAITHVGENLLGLIRDGKRRFSPRIGTLILRVADRLRRCVECIDRTGAEDEEDDSSLVRALETAQLESIIEEPVTVPTTTEPDEALASSTDATVRVHVEVLDRLMDLVGELVLVRNQLLQRIDDQRDPHLVRSVKQLNEITGRLQDGVMQTRMQPIRTVWNRFPRLVRDTASFCGKEVNLRVTGADTEIDRSVIEAIRDPLTHLIRNAIDHGIEAPAERQTLGKPRAGTIRLHAEYENGQVVLSVSDDGRGIDAERVRRKAIQKGLISATTAASMTPEAATQLIFLPGFSTADSVTAVSGRGVGMDVVRTNVESIGGSIEIHSEPGHGSRFRLRIPLSLAIVQGLIVRAGDERFVIPQTALSEVVRLEGAERDRAVHMIEGAAILQLRGRLIPLLSLAHTLGLEEVAPIEVREAVHVVILQVDGGVIGLVVDDIDDTEEIVIKPLGRMLASLRIYCGATILGDGMLALVIDAVALAAHAAVRSPPEEITPDPLHLPAQRTAAGSGFVVVEETNRRFGIDLSEVHRLEPLPPDCLRPSLSGQVVKYRGEALQVYRLAMVLGIPEPNPSRDSGSLVVIPDGDREIGLLVDRVIDIVTQRPIVDPDESAERVGVDRGEITEYLPVGFWQSRLHAPRTGGECP